MKQRRWNKQVTNKLRNMKKLVYVWLGFLAVIISMSGCGQGAPKMVEEEVADSDSIVENEIAELDSTVYGVCGEGTSMHTVELITDGGDTLYYSARLDEDADVIGGMMVGDRLAVIGKEKDGLEATRVINLTTLLGKWTSLDKNFEIVEGGMVNSNVQAESNPWVSWKILNGRLLLNTDTFDIVELGADSLYLENRNGIFVYKRVQ